MPFKFSLQQLLRLRESIEERERVALETCLREVDALRAGLHQLEFVAQQRRRLQRERLDHEGLSGAELHFDVDRDYSESLAAQQLQQGLSQAQHKCDAQRQRYSAAHRSRELLEHLRDQQRDAFMRDQARREQNAADDLFLVHAVRERRP